MGATPGQRTRPCSSILIYHTHGLISSVLYLHFLRFLPLAGRLSEQQVYINCCFYEWRYQIGR